MSYNRFGSAMYSPENNFHCDVHLQSNEMWKKFNKLDTEMIITKSGRRMFPSLRVQIERLHPDAFYCIAVEMVPTAKCRFKYSSGSGWTPAGSEEAQSPNRVYYHPDSPATGRHWMSQVVTFGRLKLTNTAHPPPDQIVLSSMHRYQPRIIIAETEDIRRMTWSPHMTVEFNETKFIAVTAYQNDKITKLKIENNPFAKGFRETGQSKCKRKANDEKQSPNKKLVRKSSVEETYASLESPETIDSSSDSDSSHEEIHKVQHYSPPAAALMASYSPFMPPYPFYYGYRSYDCYPSYKWSGAPTIGAIGYPYIPASFIAQDLSVQKIRHETPRKLTDFSIRAITGIH